VDGIVCFGALARAKVTLSTTQSTPCANRWRGRRDGHHARDQLRALVCRWYGPAGTDPRHTSPNVDPHFGARGPALVSAVDSLFCEWDGSCAQTRAPTSDEPTASAPCRVTACPTATDTPHRELAGQRLAPCFCGNAPTRGTTNPRRAFHLHAAAQRRLYVRPLLAQPHLAAGPRSPTTPSPTSNSDDRDSLDGLDARRRPPATTAAGMAHTWAIALDHALPSQWVCAPPRLYPALPDALTG